MGRFLALLSAGLQFTCTVHVTCEYVTDLVMCNGPSMEPTLSSSDILLTEHISPRLSRFSRGDIVIAKSPNNPLQNVCKRIVGLPGDRIFINNGQSSTKEAYVVVPRGHIWLEGDNSSNSTDSRVYGPVPQGLVRSRALCKIWPPESLPNDVLKRNV